jgi:hypothetical protein
MAGTQLFNFASGTSNPTSGLYMPSSNQYGTVPGASNGGGGSPIGLLSQSGANAGTNIPGIVPSQSSPLPATGGNPGGQPNTPYAPAANNGYYVGNPQDPGLTYSLFNWLQSQVGKGVTPFNLSSLLPSGGTTAPGQLTAPNNGLIQQLMSGFMGNGPDSSLGSMVRTGNPIDQTQAWQAMVDSMSQNTARNQANLKEQFNVGGGLVGSPYGDAMQNYMAQTSKDQNAMLLSAQTQSMENAQNRELQAGGMAEQFGQYMQGLDQSSIDRLLQEFTRDSPQNNPLLQYMFGGATTYPPYLSKTSGGGALGGILGGIGGILGAGGSSGIGAALGDALAF